MRVAALKSLAAEERLPLVWRVRALITRCALFGVALGTVSGAATAQRVNNDLFYADQIRAEPVGLRPARVPDVRWDPTATRRSWMLAADSGTTERASRLAPVASLIVPGSGQAMLRQQRSLGYLVAEGFLIIQARRIQRDQNAAVRRYRAIAADVARLSFGVDRPDGPWEYYETLAYDDVNASGAFDLGVGGKFTPEVDETTYNGRQWLIARLQYWESPSEVPPESSQEYKLAVEFYRSRAVQGSFRWSWRDNQNAKELYQQTIRETNSSNRELGSVVGLLAANHLVSLIDAYITVRLRRNGGAGIAGTSFKTQFHQTGFPGDHSVVGSIRVSVALPGRGRRQ